MTEIKRYVIYSGAITPTLDGHGDYVSASDYDQLQRELEQQKAYVMELLLAQVDFREQAAQTFKDRALAEKTEAAKCMDAKLQDAAYAHAMRADEARLSAETILNLPLPPSAERISKVLEAAEKLAPLVNRYALVPPWHEESLAMCELCEAVREWREAE